MGVDFYLFKRKHKTIRKSDVVLPEIEARFAATEYPRFLSQLAREAGIGAAWDNYRESGSALTKAIVKRGSIGFDPERPFGLTKKERRRAKKQARREGNKTQSEIQSENQSVMDDEIQMLRQRTGERRKAVEDLSGEHPIAEFLLAPMDGGEFDGEACRRIGPRIRSIAENWEPAPRGYVSWREHALEIADAMEIAAKHPDVVFGICG
jgi:hypothetical protein